VSKVSFAGKVMPLSLFDHRQLRHYRSIDNESSHRYSHAFGGTLESYGLRFVNVDQPFHLLYRLDLSDPTIPVELDGIQYLPLVYGFRYATNGESFTYRVLNDIEIEVVAPEELLYDPDFPRTDYPTYFHGFPVAFERLPYDPAVAEDALALQTIFGLDGLSKSELDRAIKIGLSDGSVCYSRDDLPDPDWTDEDILICLGRAPFGQGPPSASCKNPKCTADVAYHVEADEIEMPAEFVELTGQRTMKMDAYDVRVDTLRVIAIHKPPEDDKIMWGMSGIQLVFQICDCCGCISVSNQCG